MTALTYTQGTTFTWTATITATDVTGSTLWFTVKRQKDEATSDPTDALALVKNYWQAGSGSGIAVTATSPDSVVVVTIAPSVTATFNPAYGYVWDLKWKTTGGAIEELDAGTLTGALAVTQRSTTP